MTQWRNRPVGRDGFRLRGGLAVGGCGTDERATVWSDVNLTVRAGQFVAILGPNRWASPDEQPGLGGKALKTRNALARRPTAPPVTSCGDWPLHVG